MKEALFVLIVILVLLGLTLFRYRKFLLGAVGMARMLNEAKRTAREQHSRAGGDREPVPLIQCSVCKIWVPRNKAVHRLGSAVCTKCQEVAGT
jgi:hypothetical protein